MQHRGQESAGICVANGETLTFKKGMGFVSQVFDETDISSLNNGVSAIGHTRYSTEGLSVVQNAHPIEMFDPHNKTTVAVAHNGTIVGATQLRAQMEKQGCEFTTQTDTEAFGHALLSHATSWEERFSVAMERATCCVLAGNFDAELCYGSARSLWNSPAVRWRFATTRSRVLCCCV